MKVEMKLLRAVEAAKAEVAHTRLMMGWVLFADLLILGMGITGVVLTVLLGFGYLAIAIPMFALLTFFGFLTWEYADSDVMNKSRLLRQAQADYEDHFTLEGDS